MSEGNSFGVLSEIEATPMFQSSSGQERTSTRRRELLMGGFAGAVSCAFPLVSHAATALVLPTAAADRRFSVKYKGIRIGTHAVSYSSATGETRVKTQINLEVKVAFITAYAFSHRSEETWRAGRLVSLNSETVEHGEPLHVEGMAMPQGFRVVSKGGPFIASAATLTVKQSVDTGDAGADDGGRCSAWRRYWCQRTQAYRRANRDTRRPGSGDALHVHHALLRRQRLVRQVK